MYQLQKAKLDIKQAAMKLAKKEGERDLLLQQKDTAEGKRDAAVAKLGQFDLVQILLQKTSDYARQQAKKRLEEVVTSALKVVFGHNYSFKIELKVKANQPVAEYWLENNGVVNQLKPPDYDEGGGIVDVICLALRLAVGELSGIQGPLFLDEVGKHVSKEYAPQVAYFLKEYGRQFDRQIILVTHSEELAEIGDTSIGISAVNGRSKVSVL